MEDSRRRSVAPKTGCSGRQRAVRRRPGFHRLVGYVNQSQPLRWNSSSGAVRHDWECAALQARVDGVLPDTNGAFRFAREREDEATELPNPLRPRRAINGPFWIAVNARTGCM